MKIENNHAHKYRYLCFRLCNFAQLEIQYKKLFQDISQACVAELTNSQEHHLKSMKVYINRRLHSSTNITYGTIENLHPQTPGIIVTLVCYNNATNFVNKRTQHLSQLQANFPETFETDVETQLFCTWLSPINENWSREFSQIQFTAYLRRKLQQLLQKKLLAFQETRPFLDFSRLLSLSIILLQTVLLFLIHI